VATKLTTPDIVAYLKDWGLVPGRWPNSFHTLNLKRVIRTTAISVGMRPTLGFNSALSKTPGWLCFEFLVIYYLAYTFFS